MTKLKVGIIAFVVMLVYSNSLLADDNKFLVGGKTDSLSKRQTVNFKVFGKKNEGYRAFSKKPYYSRKYNFLEQGVSALSFRLGANWTDTENDWLGTNIAIADRMKVNANVSLGASHFIKDNVSVGIRGGFQYKESYNDMTAQIFQTTIDAYTWKSQKASISGYVTTYIRNYIPIGNTQRFFLFNETTINYAYQTSIVRDVYDLGTDKERIKKLERRSHAVGIGISPGVTYFMGKGFAFECLLSPLIAYYSNSKVVSDEQIDGGKSQAGFDFKLNLFNIQLGFSYYFGLDYDKYKTEMAKIRM